MIRVLFVDDEPNVLEGLQRLLRPMRKEWDTHYASYGAVALELMGQLEFDVVVSDVRMFAQPNSPFNRLSQKSEGVILLVY